MNVTADCIAALSSDETHETLSNRGLCLASGTATTDFDSTASSPSSTVAINDLGTREGCWILAARYSIGLEGEDTKRGSNSILGMGSGVLISGTLEGFEGDICWKRGDRLKLEKREVREMRER